MHKRRRVGHEKGLEIELFEDDFVDGALNGGECEEGLGEENGGVGGMDFEEGGEEMGPYR